MQQNKFIRFMLGAGLCLSVCFALLLGVYDFILPDQISCHSEADMPDYPLLCCSGMGESVSAFLDGAENHGEDSAPVSAEITRGEGEFRLLGLLPLKRVEIAHYSDIRLIPGGMSFGVKLYTDGVLVVGLEEVNSTAGRINPAADAGIQIKDIITHINGTPITGADAMTAQIEAAGGCPITITYTRDGVPNTVTVTPVADAVDGRYKTGMWVRDSGAGIGTVTYIVPSTGEFGGLGHGICDTDTGELIPMQRGVVMDVTINGVVRGEVGAPGELKGCFRSFKRGALTKNTTCGVFGVFSSLPDYASEEALPIALRGEIQCGPAQIRCTLDEGCPRYYGIEITSVNKNASGSKSFVIHVTDPDLLEQTGGIVQGMSGSPIIQNGKLVGAVTHVLINDPTRGYGIFIETMLDAGV